MSTPTTASPSTSLAPPPLRTSLVAGALAGTTVDLALFPLDTLKTRLQSPQGFAAAGGFAGVYRGLGSAVVASAPGAAFFFVTYEGAKRRLAERRRRRRRRGSPSRQEEDAPLTDGDRETALDHVLAASLGEVAACGVRVPSEVVKQRAQAGQSAGGRSLAALGAIVEAGRGRPVAVLRELYRGFGVTVLRELPFTAVQFPLWEWLKRRAPLEALRTTTTRRTRTQQRRSVVVATSPFSASMVPPVPASRASPAVAIPASPAPSDAPIVVVPALDSALYGSVSGAVAAGLTTPLDVLKTRVMLSARRTSAWSVAAELLRTHGWRPFVAGMGPRVAWISLGGAVFLGSYQWGLNLLQGRVV